MKQLKSINGNSSVSCGKDSSKTVLQIIDMSDKMLYNELKARQQFVTLIKAAVSHELRNPLNSLIGQIESFMELMKNLKKLKDGFCSINKDVSSSFKQIHELSENLNKVFIGLKDCGKKIVSATKFIDYFVHDMLDFTVLN